jgi:hypothetical protein
MQQIFHDIQKNKVQEVEIQHESLGRRFYISIKQFTDACILPYALFYIIL